MPLPAVLIPLIPVVGGAVLFTAQTLAELALEELMNPAPAGGEYDEDCLALGGSPVFASDGEYIACDMPVDPVPNSPSAPKVPPISLPPQKPYEAPYYPPEPGYEPPPPPPPLPPRRLPVPLAPTTDPDTPTAPPNKFATVKLASNFLSYGALLHEPINRSPVKVRVAFKDPNIKNNFKAKQVAAARKFLLWLISKDNDDLLEAILEPGEKVPTNVIDLGYVLINKQTAINGQPKTFAIFGVQAVAELFSDYSRRNFLEFSKVAGTIPVNWAVDQIVPPTLSSDDTLKNLTVGATAGGGGGSSDRLEEIAKAIGVDEFPATLPKRLIYPNATGEETVESLLELLGYQVRQIDKAVGYLPQKIKVLDVNAALPGNQTVEVNIHSFADFARETLQYLIDTEGDDDTLANIAVRILYECGAIHQGVVQGNAMLDATVEHLDFKEKWTEAKVPFAFDPYAGQKDNKAGFGTGDPIPLTEAELEKLLPDLLKETMVKIRVLKNDQKKTLSDVLLEILKEARTAAAGVSEPATTDRLEEVVQAAQTALQLQNAITRNNVRKGLTSGDLRTRKLEQPPEPK